LTSLHQTKAFSRSRIADEKAADGSILSCARLARPAPYRMGFIRECLLGCVLVTLAWGSSALAAELLTTFAEASAARRSSSEILPGGWTPARMVAPTTGLRASCLSDGLPATSADPGGIGSKPSAQTGSARMPSGISCLR